MTHFFGFLLSVKLVAADTRPMESRRVRATRASFNSRSFRRAYRTFANASIHTYIYVYVYKVCDAYSANRMQKQATYRLHCIIINHCPNKNLFVALYIAYHNICNTHPTLIFHSPLRFSRTILIRTLYTELKAIG